MTAPRVARSIAELVDGATPGEVFRPGDARSGSTFQRFVVDGEPHLLKTLSYDSDWIMRVTGDVDYRAYRLWCSGLMHRLPDCIDHAVVGEALEGSGTAAIHAVLMRDVGPAMIPEGDDPVPADTHRGLLDGLAALSAAFWGWRDDLGLTTMVDRLRFFSMRRLEPEVARPDPADVPPIAVNGWTLLADRDPALHKLCTDLHEQPGPLVRAIATTPSTFLHGDWKMGNLGRHPDGRVVLVDWAYPGAGPACWDLGWYLALNRARLPEAKEDCVAHFGESLSARGVDTAGWYQVQMALALLAVAVTFGWEKAYGDDAELDWWARRAFEGAAMLDAMEPGWR